MRGGLFPFDGAGGLGSQIPQNTVDAGDLVSDAVHDVLHHAEVQLGHLGGDGIHGVDGPDDDRPVEGTLAVDDAGGLDVGHYGEVLPDLALQTVLCELLTQDGIGFAHSLQSVSCDGTQTAHAQTGTGEGLSVNHAVGQTQSLAAGTHLILKQQAQGLNQLLKINNGGQTAYVMMGFDDCGIPQTAFDDIGINRTLHQIAQMDKSGRGGSHSGNHRTLRKVALGEPGFQLLGSFGHVGKKQFGKRLIIHN